MRSGTGAEIHPGYGEADFQVGSQCLNWQCKHYLQQEMPCAPMVRRIGCSNTEPEPHFSVVVGAVVQKCPNEHDQARHFETFFEGGNHAVHPILVAV